MATNPNEMVGAFQNYQDASYEQARRTIDPQQDAQRKRFEQNMVNKGLSPGSQAYNLAQSQMQRGMSDQNTSATFGAMQFGLGAQNQAFGQDLQRDQFGLAQDRFGESQRQFNLGLGQRESEFGRNFGQRQSEFDQNFGFQQNQADFSNMMGMGDFAMRLGDFSNRNRAQDFNMQGSMLAQAPGGRFMPIDTQGAYNASMTGANNVYQGEMGAYNAMVGAVGNVAGAVAMPSALEFKILDGKTDMKERNRIAAKMLTMPVYSWDYKPQYREDGDHKRFGILANDFNRVMIGDEDEQTIDIQRYTSALHLTIQEMFYEVRRLENLLWHVAEAQGIPMDAKAHSGKRGMGRVFDIAEKLEARGARGWTPVEGA